MVHVERENRAGGIMWQTQNRWLIIELADQAFGLGIEYVQELIDLTSQQIHRIPYQGREMAGVIRVRSAVIPLLDLRALLGMPSMEDETAEVVDMLHQRRQDHIRWIEELEASVLESRPFRLATDPHACGFGKWYDALMGDRRALDRFTNGNLALRNVLDSFDLYHRRIHGIAERVTRMVEGGQVSEARALIDATRDTDLATMVELFDRTCDLVSTLRRGCVVLVRFEDGTVGLPVDRVLQVTEIPVDAQKTLTAGPADDDRLVRGVAHVDGGKLIQLLQLDRLPTARCTAV